MNEKAKKPLPSWLPLVVGTILVVQFAEGVDYPGRMLEAVAIVGPCLPAVSYLGPAMAALLTGSLVVEQIFGLPGIGRWHGDSTLPAPQGNRQL